MDSRIKSEKSGRCRVLLFWLKVLIGTQDSQSLSVVSQAGESALVGWRDLRGIGER